MEPLMSLTFSQLLVPVLLAVIIGLIVGFSFLTQRQHSAACGLAD